MFLKLATSLDIVDSEVFFYYVALRKIISLQYKRIIDNFSKFIWIVTNDYFSFVAGKFKSYEIQKGATRTENYDNVSLIYEFQPRNRLTKVY